MRGSGDKDGCIDGCREGGRRVCEREGEGGNG